MLFGTSEFRDAAKAVRRPLLLACFATAECFGTNGVNEVFIPYGKKAPADRRRLSVEALVSLRLPRTQARHRDRWSIDVS